MEEESEGTRLQKEFVDFETSERNFYSRNFLAQLFSMGIVYVF